MRPLLSLIGLLLFITPDKAQLLWPPTDNIQAVFAVEKIENGIATIDLGTIELDTTKYQFDKVTIVNAEGSYTASWLSFDKSCLNICGTEVCHAVAKFKVIDEFASLPALALSTKVDIKAQQKVAAEATDDAIDYLKTRSSAAYQFPKAEVNKASRFRWEYMAVDGSFNLHVQFRDYANPDQFFSHSYDDFSLEYCKLEKIGALTQFYCPDHAFLYAGDELLYVTQTDGYGFAKINFLSQFTIGAAPYYLVEMGTKGSTLMGLLVQSNAGWRMISTFRSYPSIC